MLIRTSLYVQCLAEPRDILKMENEKFPLDTTAGDYCNSESDLNQVLEFWCVWVFVYINFYNVSRYKFICDVSIARHLQSIFAGHAVYFPTFVRSSLVTNRVCTFSCVNII